MCGLKRFLMMSEETLRKSLYCCWRLSGTAVAFSNVQRLVLLTLGIHTEELCALVAHEHVTTDFVKSLRSSIGFVVQLRSTRSLSAQPRHHPRRYAIFLSPCHICVADHSILRNALVCPEIGHTTREHCISECPAARLILAVSSSHCDRCEARRVSQRGAGRDYHRLKRIEEPEATIL